jgi:F-type H+-transporting ATPase subunit alpha
MTDGQLYLSSELFYEGIKPAIDVGLSVSRIGNKVQSNVLRWASGGLRLELLQYQELVRLSRFASTTSEAVALRQRRGALLRRLMAQPAHQPMPVEDQTLLFYAFTAGWAQRLTEEGVVACLAGLSQRLPAFAREALSENPPMTPALHAKLETALEGLLRPYLQQPEKESHAIAEIPSR